MESPLSYSVSGNVGDCVPLSLLSVISDVLLSKGVASEEVVEGAVPVNINTSLCNQ